MTNKHLGNFWRGSGDTRITSYPAHRHICVRWLGLVSVVGWDYCLGGIVPCVTSTECGRTNIDDDSSNLIWSPQSAMHGTRHGARTSAVLNHDDCQRIHASGDRSKPLDNKRKQFDSESDRSQTFSHIRMASVSNSRKRKVPAPEPVPRDEQLFSTNALEMLSEDEQDEEPQSDDGDYEEFPEIDAASDTEEEDEEEDEEDEEDKEGYSSDASSNDKKLHIFPKAKIVISDITGEPKKVYPEIEPDYDSDSSTEDVSTFPTPPSADTLRY